jgi:hypothetical protein
MNARIERMSVTEKISWLKQRGWIANESLTNMYVSPDTGVSYCFNVALKLAEDDCKIDTDYDLKP